MNELVKYKALVKAMLTDSYKLNKIGNTTKKKILNLAVIGFIGLMSSFFIVTISMALAVVGAKFNIYREMLFLLLAVVQIFILFFGIFAVMNYMYFSKDRVLVSTLPVKSATLFMAKFTLVYIGELAICAAITIPMLITYGIVLLVNGVNLVWSYFLFSLLSVFVLPILPILLVCIFSLPIMYLVAFFKKRSTSNVIGAALLFVILFGIYFLTISSFGGFMSNVVSMEQVSDALMQALIGFKNITFFNAPLINTLLGIKLWLNLPLTIISIGAIAAITCVLAQFFYQKGFKIMTETGDTGGGKVKKGIIESKSFEKSFIIKEIKNLLGTPMVLLSTIMGTLLLPVMIIMMSIMFTSVSSVENAMQFNSMYVFSFSTYLGMMLITATNQVSTIGISREGEGISILKSLPISGDNIIKIKLKVANTITLISSAVGSIAFIAVNLEVFYLGIVLFAIFMTAGLGINCISILNDLRNPFFKWKNISELTKNNKRMMKPMILIMGIGFFALILGSLLSFSTINPYISYLIFSISCILPNIVVLYIGTKNVKDKVAKLFDELEV